MEARGVPNAPDGREAVSRVEQRSTRSSASSNGNGSDRPAFQVLDRTFAILDLFDELRPEWTATEIARTLDLPVPTTHRILMALKQRGYVSQHGPGMSPVVHRGMVFVNVDDDEHAELVAFDARTGDKKWVKERKKERACYSTPFILKRGDATILGHTGSQAGFRSFLYFNPATSTAVIAAFNTTNSAAPASAAFTRMQTAALELLR